MNFTEKSKSLRDTRDIALKISKHITNNEIIFLNGALGAGKTTFVGFLVAAFKCSKEVSSPTFTIMNTYECGEQYIFHFDLYRIKSVEELEQTGFFEYMETEGLKVIEWADKFNLKEYFGNVLEINIVNANEERIFYIKK